MSITTGPGYVINPSLISGPATAGTAGQIVTDALAILGSNSPTAQAIGLAGVREGLRVLNLYGPYFFGTEVQADIDLVSGQEAYALPATSIVARALQLINADGKVYRTLGHLPWEHRNMTTGLQDQDGEPVAWTSVNPWQDQEVLLWPIPDDATADAYDLRITNVHRIPQITALDTVIMAPEDAYQCLVYYTEYYLAEKRIQENPALAERKFIQFERARKQLKALDREQNDLGSFQLRVVRGSNLVIGPH